MLSWKGLSSGRQTLEADPSLQLGTDNNKGDLKEKQTALMANTTKLSKEERKKVKTHRPQESEDGKAAEAAGVCPWLEEAQSEEDGARRGEAVKGSTWHLALGLRG